MSATVIKQGLPLGIYFGLANEVYQNDPALSRSDIVNLLDTPRTYHDRSWMNPDRKYKQQSSEMEYGEAFHCLLFEPREFEKRWFVWPIDEWNAAKRRIEHKEYFRIVESIKVLREGEESGLFLKGGVGEVTIIFEYNGLIFRTRHDNLAPLFTVDFKTTRGLHDELLKRSFREYGLDVQCALYQRSRKRFKQQYLAGEAHVYGEVNSKFFDNFMNAGSDEFQFIFQRKDEPYPYEPLWPSQDTFDSGYNKIEKACELYKHYMSVYGPNRRWPACTGKAKEFSMYYGKRDNI